MPVRRLDASSSANDLYGLLSSLVRDHLASLSLVAVIVSCFCIVTSLPYFISFSLRIELGVSPLGLPTLLVLKSKLWT
jgi:hypothetical protein